VLHFRDRTRTENVHIYWLLLLLLLLLLCGEGNTLSLPCISLNIKNQRIFQEVSDLHEISDLPIMHIFMHFTQITHTHSEKNRFILKVIIKKGRRKFLHVYVSGLYY
jgi:hypothetical protein